MSGERRRSTTTMRLQVLAPTTGPSWDAVDASGQECDVLADYSIGCDGRGEWVATRADGSSAYRGASLEHLLALLYPELLEQLA